MSRQFPRSPQVFFSQFGRNLIRPDFASRVYNKRKTQFLNKNGNKVVIKSYITHVQTIPKKSQVFFSQFGRNLIRPYAEGRVYNKRKTQFLNKNGNKVVIKLYISYVWTVPKKSQVFFSQFGQNLIRPYAEGRVYNKRKTQFLNKNGNKVVIKSYITHVQTIPKKSQVFFSQFG